jgi:hypothetical protein
LNFGILILAFSFRSTTQSQRAPSRRVRRQLLLSVTDNYFSRSTTITPEAARSAAAGAGDSPPAGVLAFRSRYSGRWESGKPGFGFPLFSRPRRRSCGNVGISTVFGEISKGLVERVGSLRLAFHAFHSPGISTAPCVVPSLPRRRFPHCPSACWFFFASSAR